MLKYGFADGEMLTPIFDSVECIPGHQFGFRAKNNTIKQTRRLVNVVKKGQNIALSIDVSQAFNRATLLLSHTDA